MENFVAYNPTKLHFGKGVLENLYTINELRNKRVLFVYGKKSIKTTGLYIRIKEQLVIAGSEVFEYEGIQPNPRVEDVNAAAKVGRDNNVDVVLAVGGGSVIDSAKIISITIPVDHDAWDFYSGKRKPQRSVPMIAVLTLAATGTEMNPFAVLQNEKEGRKDGYGHPLCFPAHSFLDPEVTYTVPADYTAYGIADLIAHCLENYFGKGDCTLSDRFIFAIIEDAMEWGPKLMKHLTGYNERAAIMYDATMALNMMTQYGKTGGDWGTHSLGHVVSLLYGTAHGATLSILFPAWMKLFKKDAEDRIVKLGNALWNVTTADETIKNFEKFFTSIGSPVRFSEIGFTQYQMDEIIALWKKNKAGGSHYIVTNEAYAMLAQLAY